MSIHDGHRQRLKQRFLEEGLESFTDIQVLELLLFFSVPRQDTNPIAHALLDHFGSLYQVLEAPVEELRKVKGVGDQSALLLSLMNDVARYYQVDRTMREKILPTVQACGEYLVPFSSVGRWRRYSCCAWTQNARCCAAKRWGRGA